MKHQKPSFNLRLHPKEHSRRIIPFTPKVEILFFREESNYTDIIIHIVNPPIISYKYPLDNPPNAGWIWLTESGNPRIGELDIVFTSQGSFGFYIISNMTVEYVATDKEVIRISPYEVRFQIESTIQIGGGVAVVVAGITTIVGLIKVRTAKGKKKEQKEKEIKRKPQKSSTLPANHAFAGSRKRIPHRIAKESIRPLPPRRSRLHN